MGTIKYVQLAAGDFLADPDFQLMSSSERGIYCSIIFYMYLNDGKILNNPERIKKLCNISEAIETFEENWKTVQKKFVVKNGHLTHKRVRKELAKAKKFFQTQRRAGLMGAEKRWGRHNEPNGSDIAEPMANKVKVSKVKESKTKEESKSFQPPTLEEVAAQIEEKNYQNITPDRFFLFYGCKGWMVGKNKMVNWRLALARADKWDVPTGQQSVKTKLYPIKGRICGVRGCPLPAVYKAEGDYDNYYCTEHMPERVKEQYA